MQLIFTSHVSYVRSFTRTVLVKSTNTKVDYTSINLIKQQITSSVHYQV